MIRLSEFIFTEYYRVILANINSMERNVKKVLKVILCVTSLCMSSYSSANYTCKGKVTGVAITPQSGVLMVAKVGPLSWPQLCKFNVEYAGVSPETCKAIYSTLLAAQMSQKDVTLWFNDGKDCSTTSHVPWQLLTGWYFGPMIN